MIKHDLPYLSQLIPHQGMVLIFLDLFLLPIPAIYLGTRETYSANLRGHSRSIEGGNIGSCNRFRQFRLSFGRRLWRTLIRHWCYDKFIDSSSCPLHSQTFCFILQLIIPKNVSCLFVATRSFNREHDWRFNSKFQ